MRIIELADHPGFIETIVDWNLKQWPKPERSREDVKARVFGKGIDDKLPRTLVLEEGNLPIGYSTMVLYEKGRAAARLPWIDAVYVTPESRKNGLGSMLIRATEKTASRLGISELFALTDIPELYLKLGWTVVEVQDGHPFGVVLSKRLEK